MGYFSCPPGLDLRYTHKSSKAAVGLGDVYYGACFDDYQSLVDWVNSYRQKWDAPLHDMML